MSREAQRLKAMNKYINKHLKNWEAIYADAYNFMYDEKDILKVPCNSNDAEILSKILRESLIAIKTLKSVKLSQYRTQEQAER